MPSVTTKPRRSKSRRRRVPEPIQQRRLQSVTLSRRARDRKLIIEVAARDKAGKAVHRRRTLAWSTDEREAMQLALALYAELDAELQAQDIEPPWMPVRRALLEAEAAAKEAVERAHVARGPGIADNVAVDLMGWVCLMLGLDGRSTLSRLLSRATRDLPSMSLMHDPYKGGYWLNFRELCGWVPSGREVGVQRAGLEAAREVLRERLGVSGGIWEALR